MKTGATVKDLIEIGVFVKVEASEAPLAKKPKIEPKVEAEPVAKLISTPATPAQARGKQVEIYRHRVTGEHFTISAAKKMLIGRVNEKTKELFGSKTAKELIEDGTLQLMGTRHVKPQFDHGVFRMAVDDKNRMIEIASQDDVTVFTFDIDQEVLDVLLEGEENFIRLEDKSSEDFQTSQSILKELLRLKPDSEDLNNQLRSAFADPDTKGSNPEWDYDDEKETLVIKETHKGRC